MKNSKKKFMLMFLLGMLSSLPAQTDSLNISWNANPESDMYLYRLYRQVNSGSMQIIQSIPHPQTSTSDREGIRPGNLYAYTLVAQDSAGNFSGFSDTVAVGIPRVQWTVALVSSGAPYAVPFDSVAFDPDHSLSQLTYTFSEEDHISVERNSSGLVLTPVPLDYSGPASFKLKIMDSDQLWDQALVQVTVEEGVPPSQPEPQVVDEYYLAQSYPNPFNPSTIIEYGVPKDGDVLIVVYNMLGQKVKEIEKGFRKQGVHYTSWDGTDQLGERVPNGIYFYQIIAGSYQEARKVAFIK